MADHLHQVAAEALNPPPFITWRLVDSCASQAWANRSDLTDRCGSAPLGADHLLSHIRSRLKPGRTIGGRLSEPCGGLAALTWRTVGGSAVYGL